MIDPVKSKRSFFYMGTVLLLLILFSFANTLSSPFNFDDHAVLNHISLYTPGQFLNFSTIWDGTLFYRHLFFLSFSLNHSLGGLNPIGYHLVNITFHLLTSFTLFFIIYLTMKYGSNQKADQAFGIAGLTSILFATNPLSTETVTYLSGRTSGIAAFFYLLAILFFILGSLKKVSGKASQVLFYTLTLISFIAAMLSKETSLTLPAVIALYEVCFINKESWCSLKTRLKFLYFPFVASILALILLQYSLQDTLINGIEKLNLKYILNQAKVVAYALKLCFFPINLVFDYDFTSNWLSSGFFKGLSVLLWLTLIILIIKKFKSLEPVIPFSIFWFILTISITNSFLPRIDLLSERNLYLPAIGPAFLVSFAFYNYLIKQSSIRLKKWLILICLIVTFQGSLTIKRNSIYLSNISLWEDTLKKSPSDLKALHNLSHFYLEKKDHKKALITLVKLSRSSASAFYKSFAYSNLGSIHAENKNFSFAEKEFKKAIQLDPTIPLGYLNLGTYYASRGWHEKAKITLQMAKDRYDKYRWGYPMPHALNFSLAHVNYDVGSFSESKKYLTKYLRKNPESPKGLLLLGRIYQKFGDTDSALETYRKIKDDPKIKAKAFNNLGLVYLSLNEPEKALVEFKNSLRANPDIPDTHFNLGKLIIDLKEDKESARAHLKKALSLVQSPALKVQIKNLLQKISS